MRLRAALALATALLAAPAFAQEVGPRAISTGGPQGAYHTQFCPPLPAALARGYFHGYACTPSRGTVENIQRVLEQPTRIGFAQFDVYAREAQRRPSEFARLRVIRQDIACEGLWMVTRNESLTDLGAVLALARRIPFVTPAEGSGSAASFDHLRSVDPDGLGRVPDANIARVSSALDVVNRVAHSTSGEVGFFVQFADSNNAVIQAVAQQNLRVIPVVTREMLRSRVGDAAVYEVQSFRLTPGGVMTAAREVTTACTPVVLFTGAPDSVAAGSARADHEEMIAKLRDLPRQQMLPQDSRIAQLISGARRLSAQAAEQAAAGVQAAREAAERAMAR